MTLEQGMDTRADEVYLTWTRSTPPWSRSDKQGTRGLPQVYNVYPTLEQA